MKSRRFSIIGILIVGILLLGSIAAWAGDEQIRRYGSNGREFKRAEIGDKTIYYQQRMIGNAIVEKDFIVSRFEDGIRQESEKNVTRQGRVPENVTPIITKEQAEVMVEGKVLVTKLYIISPDSDVFPLEPTPKNPCWVVRSVLDGDMVITIIDAMTGEHLGYGVPPPQFSGFSFSGPQYANDCSWTWKHWYQNAQDWFEIMGYPTESVEYPTKGKVQSHIQSNETAMFYEVAHGDSTVFTSECSPTGYVTASDIGSWIADYPKMPFSFLGSCNGMCNTGAGTISYEFRKGSLSDTASVGYCGMSEESCWDCWIFSLDWQDAFFRYLNEGHTVKEAYVKAIEDYPMCAPSQGPCMRFAGDEDFAVVPVVTRYIDSDGDGVSDEEELGPDRNDPTYDGNQDSTPDFLQDNSVSFFTNDKQKYLTIACPPTATLSDVAAIDTPSADGAPSGVNFLYGFIDFIVQDLYPGGSTTVTIYLPEGSTPETYYKYGPTPDDPTNHWYEFLYDGETGATIDGNVVTLYLVDGMRGDDDLDSTNGTIIDQGGIGFSITSGGSSGGGGGGCFIGSLMSGKPSYMILLPILALAFGMGVYQMLPRKK